MKISGPVNQLFSPVVINLKFAIQQTAKYLKNESVKVLSCVQNKVTWPRLEYTFWDAQSETGRSFQTFHDNKISVFQSYTPKDEHDT